MRYKHALQISDAINGSFFHGNFCACIKTAMVQPIKSFIQKQKQTFFQRYFFIQINREQYDLSPNDKIKVNRVDSGLIVFFETTELYKSVSLS